MRHFSLAPGLPAPPVHRFASNAKIGLITALASLALAIVVGSLGLDRESTIGRMIYPKLGVVTLLAGVSAFLAGVVSILIARDRSVVTLLATLAGALLAWFMTVEMFIKG